jgi:hypothetical protein
LREKTSEAKETYELLRTPKGTIDPQKAKLYLVLAEECHKLADLSEYVMKSMLEEALYPVGQVE